MTFQLRLRTAGLMLLAAGTLAAADPPYAGKWKFNPAKSDFGETTVTYSQTPSGEMQVTAGGLSYTFKTDGKDYPAIFGTTAAWKQIDANTWETTDKLNGKVTGVDSTKLSADGKTLTIESKGAKPNGESFDDTTVYQRVSGGPGIAGKWKTKNFKMSSPGMMEFVPDGPDGLTMNILDQNATCKARFDGKDYPATGPQMPPNFTLALKKAGPRAFDMTVKNNGKAVFMSTYTVSADGKTLTETGSAVGVAEKYKSVYDKQ